MVVVFRAFSCFFAAGFATGSAAAAVVADPLALALGAGVPDRLGSALTVRSLP